MIDDKTIRLFCSKDETRPKLLNPFNISEHTYAINGHLGIRIARRTEYDKNEILEKTETVISYGAVDDCFWMDLPELGEIEKIINCSYCDGTGKSTECPECDGDGEVYWTSDRGYEYEADCLMCGGKGSARNKGDFDEECEECNGTGKITKTKNINVGSKLLNGQLLSLMKNLPGVKIAPEAVETLKPIPFKFDDGIGIIMPMRKFE